MVKEEFEYQLIDLGLPSGTLWMDRNIGASSPSDYGLYFALGETEGYTADEVGSKKNFDWGDYKYSNVVYNKLTKYCNNPKYGNDGYTDSLVTLETVDDAAYHYTNGECSTPTKEQLKELLDNTISEWVVQDGVNGWLFTSKINSNSIFITAAGYNYDGYMSDVGSEGYLWSSSLFEDYPYNVWNLNFNSCRIGLYYNYRCVGRPIRGVKNK